MQIFLRLLAFACLVAGGIALLVVGSFAVAAGGVVAFAILAWLARALSARR
jgi:hypothetical protein